MKTPHTRDGIDPTTIPGWGVDADRDNDPTYPMRDREPGEARGLTWARPPLQRRDVEVLVSIEHKRLPAVFGTSAPPMGLSGAVRRRAFRYSESQWAHWLLLILADRINMVEGLIADLARGRPPNLLAEYGLAPTNPGRGESVGSASRRRTAVVAVALFAGVGVAVLLSRADRKWR